MAGNMNTLSCAHIQTGVTTVGTEYDMTVTRGCEIVEIISTTNVSDGGTSMTPQTSIGGAAFGNVGAAIATANENDIEYASTIISAQTTLAAADIIRPVIGGSTTAAQAEHYFWIIPTSWITG